MSRLPDKRAVLTALHTRLAADLGAAEQAHASAMAGATHEEARPEHDKDTRATEASYLARGLARRVVELRETTASLQAAWFERTFGDDDRIALGALVAVEDEDSGRVDCFLLAALGGGLQVTVDGIEVRVVTPDSPIGGALLDQGLDDTVQLKTPSGARSLIVSAIR